jgi:tape measure domain-containing protein
MMKTIAGGMLAGFGISTTIEAISKTPAMLLRAADAYTILQNRLKVVTESSQELQSVYQALATASIETGAGIEALGQLYTRTGLAARSLGASQSELLEFVQAVSLSLTVSGTSALQAQGALLQLSQAMGSGIVRAEEFNSMLEGMPRLAKAAADGIEGMDGSVAKLRNSIISGEITSRQFFEAILTQSGTLRGEFERMQITVSRSLSALGNSLIDLIGTFDSQIGASKGFAGSVQSVANSIRAVSMAIEELESGTSLGEILLRQIPPDVRELLNAPAEILRGYFTAGVTARQDRKLIDRLSTEYEAYGKESGYAGELGVLSAPFAKDPLAGYKPEGRPYDDSYWAMIDRREREIEREANAAASEQKRAADERRREAERRHREAMELPFGIKSVESSVFDRRYEYTPEMQFEGEQEFKKIKELRAENLREAQEALQLMKADSLQAAGEIEEANRLRADRDIAAWKEQAKEARLSAQETALGIDLINEKWSQATKDMDPIFQSLVASAEGIAQRIGDTFADVFTDIALGAKVTAEQVIQAFTRVIISSAFQALARIGVDAAIRGLGGLFATAPVGAAGAGVATPASSAYASGAGVGAPVYHFGGLVGYDHPRERFVPASLFAGAPRLHSGLLSEDEYPAILQRGERVISKGAQNSQAPTIVINKVPESTKVSQDTSGNVTIDLPDMIDSMMASRLSDPGGKSRQSLNNYGALRKR